MIKNRLVSFLVGGCISALLVGCGGGGTLGVNLAAVPHTVPNAIPIIVDAGPTTVGSTAIQHNIAYVSVKVCAPGSTVNCQTIDHIQLDTGSTGLRILADALPSTFPANLTQVNINALPLVECMQFLDGYAWGPIKQADVTIGNYTVTGMSLQVIGDSSAPVVPSGCSGVGSAQNTVATFGANGIMGIGSPVQDCGTLCEQNAANTLYYGCANSNTCQTIAVPVASQIKQPVSLFSADNNGTLIQLPALTSGTGSNIAGSLIFGIGTQSNNTPGNTVIKLGTNPANNYAFTAQLQGFTYSFAAIDSGTTEWVFDDNGSMAVCSQNSIAPGFYCPATTQPLSAVFTGANAVSGTVNFNIANAVSLFTNITTTGLTAFDSAGSPANDQQSGGSAHTTFLAGLPFFYGRSVWTAIDGATTSLGTGPYVAYQ